MSERFTAARGRKVVSRASAEELGNVTRLVVEANQRRIVSVVVGKRRNVRLVAWENISGFGADAVMITDDESAHEPQDEHEQAAAKGDLELLGRRALSHLGNELGKIDDVTFDPDTGVLEAIVIGAHETPAGALLGAGSYAVILRTDADTPAT